VKRTLATLALLALTAVLSACGSTKYVSEGDETTYVNVGPLLYQVQMSRELNPASSEDRQYLVGVPAGTPAPAGDQEWFGVWLRVQNQTGRNLPAASKFKIFDTQGIDYFPIPLAPANVFAYQPVDVPKHSVIPDPDTAAGYGPIQGQLLLFKLSSSIYANRPLKLEITPPGLPNQKLTEISLDL
jgi:hypothetical protein